MRGLKTQEEPRFIKFMEIVEECANKIGCIFFLDAGVGRDFTQADIEGEDLQGWLIPNADTDEFENEWLKNEIDDNRWGDHFTFAIWQNVNNNITVNFK